MSFVCHSYNICFYSYVTRIPFVCHSYVFTYVIRMYPNVIHISLVCTPVSSVCYSYLLVCHVAPLLYTRLSWYGNRMCSYVVVCHSYVLECHRYVTRMYWCVIRMSLVRSDISSACHSYVLVCHLYVIRLYSYVIRMSLVCGFTRNHHLSFTSKLSRNVL